MRMIFDSTERFPERPHWEIAELEQKCEETITGFLVQRYGFERIPVPTEALTEIIEHDGANFDIKSNLSDTKYDVFGYTQFEPGKKPIVTIARELWDQRYRNNRLRMTLSHEYGHVLLHTWLYQKYAPAGGQQLCYWQSLLPTLGVLDWMEWQAGYAGGAFLMPASFVRRTVSAFFRDRKEEQPIKKASASASALSERISLTFDVSGEAATVRLAKLGYVID